MGADGALIPHQRGVAMVERVRATVAHVLGDAPAATVAGSTQQAINLRHALNPEGPVYLHPARSVLILIADTGVRDADALAAAALLETHHEALVPNPAWAPTARAAEILAAAPRPAELDADELREALTAADDTVRLVALAERLDHARHLRQYPQPEWLPMYEGIRDAYLPVAEWGGGLLGARYRRWATAFARRLPRQ